MNFDYYFGLALASPPTDHVSWQGTTVNRVDDLLTQPFHGSTNSGGVPHNVVAGHDFVGYPGMGDTLQETLQCRPPIPSNPLVLDISSDGFMRQFTGAMRPVRRAFRGHVGNMASTTCQWQSQGSLICGQEITAETVPGHLVGHGIRNMRKDLVARCCWRECGVLITRQSFTRHYREVHLGLKRKSYTRASLESSTLGASVY